MKKVVALVLVLAMCIGMVGVVSASPASIDLSSMSSDDLIALKKAIDVELANRGEIVTGTITSGTFTTGRDIKPGVYVFTKQDDGLAAIYIYDDQDKYSAHEPSGQSVISQGESATVSLFDGMVLLIDDFSGTIELQPAPSWAP